MHWRKLKWIVATYISLSITSIYAQQAISTSGKDITGSSGTISYTVGQVSYKIISGSLGTITQGVQQPIDISIVTQKKEAVNIAVECSVFPNPATDYLRLKTGNYNIEKLNYLLYDENGKLLEMKKIESNETNIVLCNFNSVVYILKVIDNNQIIKVLKIIKK